MSAGPTNTVIIGTGIIGLSTAYYLSSSGTTPPQSIHLVESSSRFFASASGLAAGFLAKDWFASPVAALGALSFDLHRELANKHEGHSNWGYSPSVGISVSRSSSGQNRTKQVSTRNVPQPSDRFYESRSDPGPPTWVRQRDGYDVQVLSDGDSTAQCDPYRLCHFLLHECLERGVVSHQPAQVLSVSRDLREEIAAVRIGYEDGRETDLPCSRLVITAGAWTPNAFKQVFPLSSLDMPISSLSGHSLIVRSPKWSESDKDLGCHAVFADEESGFSPEIFSRAGGEIYIAGLNNASLPLPAKSTDATPGDTEMRRLNDVARRLLGSNADNGDLEILRQSLCFRPVSISGRPIVSRLDDYLLGDGMKTRGGSAGGVFVSAGKSLICKLRDLAKIDRGHGPWGISLSLGTGKVLAELIEDKSTSVHISGLAL